MADRQCFTCGAQYEWQAFGDTTQLKCARCVQASRQEQAIRDQTRSMQQAENRAREEQRRKEWSERRAKIEELTRKMIDLNGEQAQTILSMRTRAIVGPAAAKCADANSALQKAKCPACRYEIPADATMCGQCRTPAFAGRSARGVRQGRPERHRVQAC